MINLNSTTLAQYAASPVLMAWISSLNSAIDPATNLATLKTSVWGAVSAATPEAGASGVTYHYGFDVWGRIVGVNRNMFIPPTLTNWFGFAEAYSGSYKWTNFYDGSSAQGPPYAMWDGTTYTTTPMLVLSNTQMQQMILAKAYANISSVSSYALNAVVRKMFGPRVCVYDNGSMGMTVNFETAATTDQSNLINYGNVLPHASGVAVTVATATIH